MRVDIYPHNEEKILKAAHNLGKSPTQMVNDIIERVNIIFKAELESVDMDFSRMKLEATPPKKKEKPKSKNWAKEWE